MIEETPLNLTAEQVTKGSPKASTELQQAGAAAENARVSALTAEFAGDPTFLTAAIADPKMTVETAKAKKYDELKPVVATLTAENKKLKEEGVVGFAASDKNSPATTATSSVDQLNEAALKMWNADENLRTEFAGQLTAFQALYRREPDQFAKKK